MLDLHSRRVQRTIPVGFSPVDVAVDERTEHVFVANDGSNSVSMLDARRPTLYEGNYVLGLRIPDAFLQGVEAGSAANH